MIKKAAAEHGAPEKPLESNVSGNDTHFFPEITKMITKSIVVFKQLKQFEFTLPHC